MIYSEQNYFPKDEQPFGISYDEWISKYGNWWVDKSIEEATLVQGGYIIDKLDSIVMLKETTVGVIIIRNVKYLLAKAS